MPQEADLVDEKNRWRLETPGHSGWPRTVRPDDPGRYLMISADCHCNEPGNLWWERIDRKFRPRLPHVETDANGEKWMVVEGYQKSRIRARNIADAPRGGCEQRFGAGHDRRALIAQPILERDRDFRDRRRRAGRRRPC